MRLYSIQADYTRTLVPKPGCTVLKKMLDAGLCVSIHSDDPAYLGGYITDNYRSVVRALGLSATDVIQMAENGIDSSWTGRGTKNELLKRLRTAVEPFEINS